MFYQYKNKVVAISTNSKAIFALNIRIISGIYIHIPFCKKACHYCDFHFSTSLKKKEEIITALCQELILRKDEHHNETIQTIYFGGGTPSVCSPEEINQILNTIYRHYSVGEHPEITLEANPDDLTETKIIGFASTKINRLSIGVQSFFEEDLQLMNRAHNAHEALESIQLAKRYFDNISIDLIYGIPGMSNERWLQNIETALSLDLPHISSYALTVEPKTALETFIKKGIIPNVSDASAEAHYRILVDTLEQAGYTNYEFSNFGKPNYFSQNNTAYWKGKSYLGIGPSAHSFNGTERSWNVANNGLYLKSILQNKRPFESEILSKPDQFNEYIMTGLRTIWGISLQKIQCDFGEIYTTHLEKSAQKYLNNKLLKIENGIMNLSKEGKFLGDGIASDLFFIPLSKH